MQAPHQTIAGFVHIISRGLFVLFAPVAVRRVGDPFLWSLGRTSVAGLVIVLLLGGGRVGHSQSVTESVPFCQDESRRTATLDTRGLGTIYCTTRPVLTRPMQVAHATARPIFYGAVPLAWAGAFLFRDDPDYTDAYRLGLAQGTTYGLVFGLKRAVGRPRPYVTRALTSRSSHYGESQGGDAYTSFPSGHAALAAALATSWSLSHPEWYVVGPGVAWAVAVALSRLHIGVHYPSDVVLGMGVGVGVAVLTHQLRGALTPAVIGGDSQNGARVPTPVRVRIRF